MKRKATTILILTLLMMALPLGSAMAAGSRNIDCGKIQIQRECTINGTSLGKYMDNLRSIKGMTLDDLRAMLSKYLCGKPAPTAAPTKAPTPAPTAAPTAAPTKAPTPAPTACATAAPTKAHSGAHALRNRCAHGGSDSGAHRCADCCAHKGSNCAARRQYVRTRAADDQPCQ